jgi:hypothetical protein
MHWGASEYQPNDEVEEPRVLTPAERRLRAIARNHRSWANTSDRSARTLKARMALEEKFFCEADPNNELTPAERAKRAANLRKAFYAELALRSVQARRRRGGVV